MRVKYLGSSSVMVDFDGAIIYFDPKNIGEEHEKADMIFVSHKHSGHFSIPDINMLLKPTTHLFVPDNTGFNSSNVHVVGEKQVFGFNDFNVLTIPSYNINKGFHLKGAGVGYVVSRKGLSVYHAGDTDFVPEMKFLKNINVAFLPVEGSHTMNAEEAGIAASDFRPDLVVPIHHDGEARPVPYHSVLFLKKGESKEL